MNHKNILEDLYFGEINPNVNCANSSCKQKCIQIVSENEKALFELLEGKEKELFFDLINAQDEIIGNSAVENFTYGFKLGARMVLEIFNGNEQSLT